ncbi:2-hydroxy-6-oxononadienedioate/2-hydroxy-6-oxononatrienedioate hydrolase-like [Salvia splendens]|uniref:2-hydroxy-6-oxononadienedioate/2-hydroxy-6- oxononatrienedioate hydrolase-like n=1 Tax=Salvia splendens TaxID=180675 RepID=UPI001C280E88|nr:2-hydroxy-6-oxononadienedioate/2-hydroxy-6-oxononatrienedioate hydrolase-like [Salvia splendens]
MERLRLFLHHILSFHISLASTISHYLFSPFSKIRRFPIITPISEWFLSVYFKFACNLIQCTVDLDDQTTMHFLAPAHRRFNKPNLVMIHGYGGNSKWQFVYQVASLAESFNVYIPDLLFFGKSYSNRANRTEAFQAECVAAGLRRLGVERCSIYAISYGGFVCYRMAEMHPELVEKAVIVSSGVGCTQSQKGEQMKNVGIDVLDLLLPRTPVGMKRLVELSVHKSNPLRWAPDFVLEEFIDTMCNTNRKEKQELVEHLLANSEKCKVQPLSQEILLVWGDKDKIFPLNFAYELQRNLGPKASLEILRDAGHAVNFDSPDSLNDLIKGFILE